MVTLAFTVAGTGNLQKTVSSKRLPLSLSMNLAIIKIFVSVSLVVPPPFMHLTVLK